MADQQVRRRYHSPLREQRAKQTREAVLAAATRLFTTQGWAATGMRDIAREAGTATETLYSYFPSKTALLQAVIKRSPLLGEHTEEVLAELGYKSEDIAALRADGAI